MKEHGDDRARQRAEVIMKVCSGSLSATEGADQLLVSRKTYYEWEKKGLTALLESLKDGEPGRPLQEQEDPEKVSLEQKVRELERELTVARQTIEVKRMLDAYQQQQKLLSSGSGSGGKKNRKPKK
jgi:uncharacterized protein involved in exopolysaccharide biosynthesis